MVRLFQKIFFFICGGVFLAEGIVGLMVRFGRVPVSDATGFYEVLLQSQEQLDIVLAVTVVFLGIGLLFWCGVFRGSRVSDIIEVKNRGEVVRIQVKTLKDFILQIIGMNSRIKDVDINIEKRHKCVCVNIFCVYSGSTPVCQEIHQVKEILKGEIERVFEFPNVTIDFQIDGINIPRTKTKFIADFVEDEEFSSDIDAISEEKSEEFTNLSVEKILEEQESQLLKDKPWE